MAKRSHQNWAALIKQQPASGLTITAFCRQQPQRHPQLFVTGTFWLTMRCMIYEQSVADEKRRLTLDPIMPNVALSRPLSVIDYCL